MHRVTDPRLLASRYSLDFGVVTKLQLVTVHSCFVSNDVKFKFRPSGIKMKAMKQCDVVVVSCLSKFVAKVCFIGKCFNGFYSRSWQRYVCSVRTLYVVNV